MKTPREKYAELRKELLLTLLALVVNALFFVGEYTDADGNDVWAFIHLVVTVSLVHISIDYVRWMVECRRRMARGED